MVGRKAMGGLFLCTREVMRARALHESEMVGRRAMGELFLCTREVMCARALYGAGLSKFMTTHNPPKVSDLIYTTTSCMYPITGPLLWHSHFHSHQILLHETKNFPARSTDGPTHEATHGPTHECVSDEETKRLLKLVKVADLKKLLLTTGHDCMPYVDVIKLCKDMGIAATNAEANAITKSLDDAGVILIFRNKVFLQPDKLAELLASVLPLSLAKEDDPRKNELIQLRKEKEEIDRIAHKQVHHILWAAFGALSLQSLLFFRLTFWDLSWDVMEPITFFAATTSLIAGLLFFIFTHRDPSYQDLMHTLFSSKQRKLMKKRNFNVERFKELQMQDCLPHSHK